MGIFLQDYGLSGRSELDSVRKHGSHDQSSHNPKKGGGAGGGGGSSRDDSATGRDDKLVDQLATDVDELKVELEEYYNDLDDGAPDDDVVARMSDSLNAAERKMDAAAETNDIDKHEALMDTAEGHLRDAASAASYGSPDLQELFARPLKGLADRAMDYLETLDEAGD